MFEPAVLPRSAYELPSGCPVAVAVSEGHPAFAPIVRTMRGSMTVDVTGSVTTSATTVTGLSESLSQNSSGCAINIDHLELPFDLYTISLAGANVGDQLTLHGMPIAVVVAAGPCPASEPVPGPEVECRVSRNEYWDCICEVIPSALECGGQPPEPSSDSGCMATPVPGLAIVLVVALSCRRRLAVW